MSRNPVPLITLLCLSLLAAGQNKDNRILLRGSSFIPQKNISIADAENFNRKSLFVAGKTFALIQFDHIPTAGERAMLSRAGIELLDYVPNNAYTATVKGSLNVSLLNTVKARAVIDLKPEQKMFTSLANKRFPSWAVRIPGTVDLWISFPKTYSFETVRDELKAKNVDIISEDYKNYRVIAVRIAQQKLTELASLPCIEYVQPVPAPDQPLNNKDVVNARANVVTSSLGRNLDGKGVVIGVGDNGDPLQHVDFSGRLINRFALAPPNAGSHGVHVMGTATGAGIVDERYKGFSPKATLIAQAFSGILAGAPAYVRDYGMVVTNNSYGNVEDDCETFGVYDLYARIMDQYAVDMPNLENVFAAGNSAFNCPPYVNSFGTVLGGFQTAKNVVTVGATTDQGVIAGFSSRGPVRDGRIKPEIVAQGQPVRSTVPLNTYGNNQGTSMASPGVAGGITLLYQRYRQLHGNNPKNGLIKTLVCNGAADKGNAGPDFAYGFGWMNLLRSVKMLENNNYFNDSVANTQTNTHSITVPANTAQLKVMLYWNDPAAAVLAAHALVNDLDLEVVDPSSGVTLPFILDTLPGNVTSVATRGADHINNIEQVVIDNPAAGTYTLRVKGTAIAQNPQQEYFLAYDTIPVSNTITYPIGGEHLTQGDFIYISWDAFGNPTNNFTIDYSSDGGISWANIGTAAAGSSLFGWTLPAGFTDKAMVRVTQNGSGLVSTSAKFTITGIPTVSFAAVQCEGYISINWTTVAEATGYEVMMLRGDEMVSMATVPAAQTNFTFNGLSKDSVYWVTVRTLLNGNPGRRALAISRRPNNGTCTGTISDNDLKVDAVLSPVSGRQFTSTALSASTVISIRIKNLDDAAINNFNIKYSVNGAPFVSEANGASIGSLGTYTHNFASAYDFSAIGSYQLRVVVENTSAADPVSANDTLTVIVKQLANAAITLNVGSDFIDDLESADSAAYYSRQIGLSNRDRYDFVSNTVYGRLRTFVNSGIAYSGDKALTLDADRYNGAGTTDSLTGTFNLSSYVAATDDIRLDFMFKHHGQAPNAANNVWVRGDDQKTWISVYDLYANQRDAGIFNKSSSIELGDTLAANGQDFSSSFQVRWGQWGQILTADDLNGAGYTFDDIHLYKVTDDIQMMRIDTPVVSSCGLGNAVPIKVTVRNSANTAITNIPVSFRKDGGAIVTETIANINGNASFQYTFTATADLSALGQHTVEVWVDYASDSYRNNDTAVVNLYNSPTISTFPYLQNFEADNGSWYTAGVKDSWEYGTPMSQKINRAASGSKAWKTSLVGNYNDLEQSYLYSPCFDISGMTIPTLSFSLALDLEDCGNTLCDAAYVEYSADGITWARLGAFGQGTNWYNKNLTGNNVNVWSIRDYTHWHVASIPLPTGLNRLRLRFVMSSDPYTSYEGIAVDDIHIYDNTLGIYNGATMGAPVTQTINGGTGWIDFTSGGKLVASIMPNSQNMGVTNVQAYINTGAVRTSTNQYYHDRNITIKPATVNLTDSATVRFYFLDSETDTLINAKNCGTCSKPSSAYELGVSKYSDPTLANENGALTDDLSGNWLYISQPDVIKVPFDKGYYAEFKVKNFSEFWLNNGGPDDMHALPVKLEKFTAVKKINNDVLLQWTTSEEINTSRYDIEAAIGYADYQQNKFTTIGSVGSRNSSSQQAYEFTDAEKNKSGVRYYRLKVVDKDGKYFYSSVKPIIFDTDIKWQVYPNPSTGMFSFVYQASQGEKMKVKVYDVNARLIKELTPAVNGFVQKATIDLQAARYTPGLYLIEVSAGEKKQLFRVIKQ